MDIFGSNIIFNSRRIRPLHRSILRCIDNGYVYPDDIKYILSIVHVDRLVTALSDLIQFGIVEIDNSSGHLRYSDDIVRLAEQSHLLVSRYIELKNELAGEKLPEDRFLGRLFESFKLHHPNALAKVIQFDTNKNDR